MLPESLLGHWQVDLIDGFHWSTILADDALPTVPPTIAGSLATIVACFGLIGSVAGVSFTGLRDADDARVGGTLGQHQTRARFRGDDLG